MDYDDERTNRTFSIILIAMILSLIVGFGAGCLVTTVLFLK
jgi:hypothetical protein